mgnify:FL=1
MILFIAQPFYIYELKRTLFREHCKVNNGRTKYSTVNVNFIRAPSSKS